MKISSQTKVKFQARSLWYLFTFFPQSIILGFPSPVKGYLKHETDAIRKKSEIDLVKEGILENTPTGIEISPKFRGLIEGVARSEHAVMSIQNQEGSKKNITFHYSGKTIIKLENMSVDEWELQVVSNSDGIADYLTKAFPDSSKVSDMIFQINKADLNEIRSASVSLEEASRKFKSTSMSIDQEDEILGLLQSPQFSGSVVVYKNKQDPKTLLINGGAFSSKNGKILLLRPCDKDGKTFEGRLVSKRYLIDFINATLPSLQT